MSLSTSEIADLPFSKADAAFNSLAASRKANIWRDKFFKHSEEKSMSVEEKNHFLSLTADFDEYHFGTDKGREELKTHALKWEDTLIQKFGWSNEDIFFAAYIWMTREEYLEAMLAQSLLLYLESDDSSYADSTLVDPAITDSIPSKVNCNCASDKSCIASINGASCNSKVDCEGVYNCGILKLFICTGICE